jgi:hypothetical protein
METWVNHLSPSLFWDVSRENVDPDKHGRWLLERVLMRGRWEDWLLIREHFKRDRIRDLSPRLRLDPKAENFLRLYCRDDDLS